MFNDSMSPEAIEALTQELTAEQERFSPIFDRVRNSDHWKGAIDAEVHQDEGFDPQNIRDAVAFYTATEATVTDVGGGWMHVTAPGYWAGPAN